MREEAESVKTYEAKSAKVTAAAGGKSVVREYAEALIIAVLLALTIRTFVVQAFKIPSGSMIPTLHIGDLILVNKFHYGVRLPVLNTKLTAGEPVRRSAAPAWRIGTTA